MEQRQYLIDTNAPWQQAYCVREYFGESDPLISVSN